MREEPFEQSARAGAGNDNVPQRTCDVRCRPVAHSKGYTYWPMILPQIWSATKTARHQTHASVQKAAEMTAMFLGRYGTRAAACSCR
jgi:hypothetical protein